MAWDLKLQLHVTVLFLLSFILLLGNSKAEVEHEVMQKLISVPHKNVGSKVIDGTGLENSLDFDKTDNLLSKGGSSKVFVSTVALFTLAMEVATVLGVVPFFFMELDPQWAGLCNGMAAGVMLVASFDLVQEGQNHGVENWVLIGILVGGIFIWLCKKYLEQYGEVSMLDIKGAEATKVGLVIGIQKKKRVMELALYTFSKAMSSFTETESKVEGIEEAVNYISNRLSVDDHAAPSSQFMTDSVHVTPASQDLTTASKWNPLPNNHSQDPELNSSSDQNVVKIPSELISQ